MNLQSKLVISSILFMLVFWLLKNFFNRKLSSGQTIFWLTILCGAEILTLFPLLVHWLSGLWGNLVPISWISFGGLVFLIFYLLHQTIRLNKLQADFIELASNITFLEAKIRQQKSPHENPTNTSTTDAE